MGSVRLDSECRECREYEHGVKGRGTGDGGCFLVDYSTHR